MLDESCYFTVRLSPLSDTEGVVFCVFECLSQDTGFLRHRLVLLLGLVLLVPLLLCQAAPVVLVWPLSSDLRGLLNPSSPLHKFLIQGRLGWERGFVLFLSHRYLSHFESTTGRQWKAEQCIWMRIYLQNQWQHESVAALRLLVSFSAKEATAVLPVMDSAEVAYSMKDIVKPSNSETGFINTSPAMKVSTPHTLLLESIVSSLTLDIKEDWLIGIPSPPSGCVTHTIEKGDDFRVNGFSESQKWLVGFGPSREVVVWVQGDEIWDGEVGDSSYPLGVLSPNLALD